MDVYHHYKHKKATLGYLKTGKGPEAMLLFHGFGQDHTAFRPIVEQLKERFTLYAFDLFFHGESKWEYGEKPLSKEFWKELMDGFKRQNAISSFYLMGFSLGGKFALATLEAFPEEVRAVYLLAPDGIKTSSWYSLATYPIGLRTLFKSMILKPGRFHSFVKMAKALHLTDKGIIRFAESQMDTQSKRSQVYFAWVVFRPFKFDMQRLATLINTHRIEIVILIGKYDKIITARNMQRLLSHVKKYQLEILDAGHNGLIQQSGKVLGNNKR